MGRGGVTTPVWSLREMAAGSVMRLWGVEEKGWPPAARSLIWSVRQDFKPRCADLSILNPFYGAPIASCQLKKTKIKTLPIELGWRRPQSTVRGGGIYMLCFSSSSSSISLRTLKKKTCYMSVSTKRSSQLELATRNSKNSKNSNSNKIVSQQVLFCR